MQKVCVMEERFLQADMQKNMEKKKWFKNPGKIVDSKRLYLPYWEIAVILQLKTSLGKKGKKMLVPMLVNAFTGSAQMVKGTLKYHEQQVDGIILPTKTSEIRAHEEAIKQALCETKKIINPPEHYTESGKLVYYPLSLVRISRNGNEEFNIFDNYQGGFSKTLLWYLQQSDIPLSFSR